MKRIILFLIVIQFSLVQFGQIIADHTVVDKYDEIPQYYINEVKKMLFVIAGQSHSYGYMNGLTALESLYPIYDVSYTGTPESYTTSHLRISRTTWGDLTNVTGWINDYGEEDWYTSETAINRTKAGISYYNSMGIPMTAFGFGHCWGDGGGSYITATQSYIDYCAANNLRTKVFFTTGPVDQYYGYSDYLVHESIRDYVAADATRILFDYADILCYDDGSETPYTVTVNGHTFPGITPTNDVPEGIAHISSAGELRLAKAVWWMLARMAGWDGGISTILVSTITVTGAGGSSQITNDNGTLQLTAAIAPTNATNQTVTWSIANGTGQATISTTGLVTAVSNGTVTARATANDGSGVYGTLVITISSQVIQVTGITVTGAGGSSVITSDNGTLQLNAAIVPTTATNQTVTWTIANGTGQATISSTGLVTAVSNGTVTARATANDGSGVYGTLVIMISSQVIPVTGITVTGAGGSSVITTDNGTLQLSAAITPTNATNQTVTWTIANGTGQATISSTGLVTAVSNGTVTARATANDGSGIYGTLVITISGQVIPVTGITVTGAGGSSVITTDNGTLQLSAAIVPTNATNQTVTWTITNGTGQATISSTGLVTAVSNGTVTARATANDGSGIYGTLVITISGQVIPVTGITVTGAGGSSVITTDNGTLQLSAAIAPTNASNQTVTWTIANGTGQATISSTGLVTAVSNGTVTARATANDGSEVYGTLVITISNQVIPVTGITVTGAGGSSVITTDNGTLQLTAAIAPTNATNQTVTWSIANGTGQATISSTGLVTAVSNGTITARATANDGSGIYGTLVITISDQVIPVTGITVTGADGSSVITTDNGTLQLSAVIAPTTATNQTITWTIANGTGQATISTTGLVSAVSNGTVTARATANDGSGIYGTLVITISSQVIPVTGITVTGAGGSSVITTDNGTLQLLATIAPTTATNQTITWTVANGTGQATINTTGLVTAVANGMVTARATANDGSGIYGTLVITISSQVIPVTGITVAGAGGSSVITTDNGTLQLSAAIAPTNATNQAVTWTIANGTGQATISSTGLVTAVSNGTVTARATANDGSGIYGTLVITISSQVIPVTGITVTGAGGSSVITTDNGTLQLSAAITPTNATNQTVTWTIANGTGQATISSTGLVTAVSSGTVTARATANDGSGIYGTLVITISSQVIPVTGITVTGAGGSSVITTDNGTLQLSAAIAPTNATNQTVTWTIANGTGQATISSTGLVTAVSNGTVTARATANDGSGIYGTLVITISSQVIPVTGITVTGAGGSSVITTDNGTLQLSAAITPTNATNQAVTWTIANGTGQATISSTGLVTAVSNGTVTTRATANDGSGIYGTLVITISSQVIPVTGITVTGAGGASAITTDNGTLQLSAGIAPTNATNQTVTWTITNGTGQATISSTGLVTAVSSGTVTARATANDGSGIYGALIITISSQVIPVTGITVTGAGGSSVITTDNGTLQLSAAIAPTNATNQTVTWSIANGTGQATISSTGLVTAVSNGTVTARATANDGSGVYGTLVITISSQVIPVTGITVTGAGGSSVITTENGTLQLSAAIAPTNATNQTVTWTIANGTGQATISSTGLVTAVSNGTVTARATANDGSGIYGTLVITISSQVIPVTGITVTGAGGSSVITTDNGTLQLSAAIAPTNATNQTVTWTIANGTGQATISSTGLVTAVSNGTVTARATANDGSGVYGTLVITISSQVIPVTGITVTGAGGSSVITTDNGTLQLTAAITPTNATNQTVTWTIANGTGQATISSTGLVTAVSNGTVTARATANDGSGIYGTLVITISSQVIPVTGITVTGAGGSSTITTDNGTLQLSAAIAPTNATNQTVTWTIANGTGQATISSTGLVTAVSNGTVTARATANDGSGVYGTLVITISSQVIPVTGITVTGAGGSSVITSDNGTLQLSAAIAPTNATNQTVTWTIANDTGQATISSTGLVTAVSNGTVTARATANDGSGIYGTLVITISSQVIPVTGITVTGAGGSLVITTDNGTLQLSAAIAPTNATNQTVTWTIANGTGQATINSTGLVTAVLNGTVTARATAIDGSGIYGTLVITISNQAIPVTRIDIASAKGESIIATDNGTLQLSATIAPTTASNQTVTWSIISGTGQASIDTRGLVTAIANGIVTARATANDGSGIFGELAITISNQFVSVTGITVVGQGGATTIDTNDGTLQMIATILPANATDQTVSWSLISGSGHAEIGVTGLVTAKSNGKVTVRALANDGSGLYGEIEIAISNQVVAVSAINIKAPKKPRGIALVNKSLQLQAEVLPVDATDQAVIWSVINGTGQATISETGLLTGVAIGEVTAVATAADGSGVYGELEVTIESIERIKIRYSRNELTVLVPDHLIPSKSSLHSINGSNIETRVVDSNECIFDISSLPAGIYVVSVYNSAIQDAAKIVIGY